MKFDHLGWKWSSHMDSSHLILVLSRIDKRNRYVQKCSDDVSRLCLQRRVPLRWSWMVVLKVNLMQVC